MIIDLDTLIVLKKMKSTRVPFVFDYTRPPNLMNTTTTADSLIPVNISMESSYPQPVNLSYIPSYSLPDRIESTEPVTLQPILEGRFNVQEILLVAKGVPFTSFFPPTFLMLWNVKGVGRDPYYDLYTYYIYILRYFCLISFDNQNKLYNRYRKQFSTVVQCQH